MDEKEKQTVIFSYPKLFTNTGILQVIRLEIGALAAWTPAMKAENIVFFDSVDEAIKNGFRPCKICMKNKSEVK